MIKIERLEKSFGKKNVLKDLNLSVQKGEFCGIFGKNGAGKSTLFKLILGLQHPTDGLILVDGKKAGFHREIGYLPENIAVYPHLSVKDNLKVSSLCADYTLSNREIKKILEDVNLLENEKTKARELSLGMKRRLQFAMATMIKPTRLLILDEPTNGLDVNGVLWLRDYLKNMHKEEKTIIICSHSLDTMEEIITNYCILKDGTIIRQGKWNESIHNMYDVELIEKQENLEKIKARFQVEKIRENHVIVRSEFNIMEFIMCLHNMEIQAIDVNKYHEKLEDLFIESVKE